MISVAPPPITEWRIADGLIPYGDAVAAMQDRVAAIRAGTAAELVWLVEHPPLYTAGTSARPRATDRPRPLPHLHRRPRRAVDLSRPRPARGLCHAGPHPPARHGACTRRALLRPRTGGVADPHPRPLRRARRTARGPRRHLGRRRRVRHRGQDRRHRRARFPLGELARRRAERRARPRPLRRHRALRHHANTASPACMR